MERDVKKIYDEISYCKRQIKILHKSKNRDLFMPVIQRKLFDLRLELAMKVELDIESLKLTV